MVLLQQGLEMTTLTVTSKGQVTFKQDLLKHLGVRPGQKIEVEKTPHGGITVKAVQKQKEIADFIGCLAQQPTATLTIDEMNVITTQAWAEQN
jgi:bifunctional DNA-binding transcriptional regulator/antitoxin component of YhaV-PrlF toxin-antitoxin module